MDRKEEDALVKPGLNQKKMRSEHTKDTESRCSATVGVWLIKTSMGNTLTNAIAAMGGI